MGAENTPPQHAPTELAAFREKTSEFYKLWGFCDVLWLEIHKPNSNDQTPYSPIGGLGFPTHLLQDKSPALIGASAPRATAPVANQIKVFRPWFTSFMSHLRPILQNILFLLFVCHLTNSSSSFLFNETCNWSFHFEPHARKVIQTPFSCLETTLATATSHPPFHLHPHPPHQIRVVLGHRRAVGRALAGAALQGPQVQHAARALTAEGATRHLDGAENGWFLEVKNGGFLESTVVDDEII